MAYERVFDHVVIKAESVPGTPETITGSDFDICIIGPSIEFQETVEFDDPNFKCANGEHGEGLSVAGNQSAVVSFSHRYKWSGTVNTPPKANTKLWPACGLAETVVGATGVKWEGLAAGDISCVTIEVFEKEIGTSPKGKKHLMSGCMGTMILTPEGVGKPVVAQYTFTGKLISTTDVDNGDLLSMSAVDTPTPETYAGAGLTIHSVSTLQTSTFSFDLGNEVTPFLNQGDTTGFKHFQITKRIPRFSTNPYGTQVATFDVYGRMKGMLTGAIVLTLGTTNLIINMPYTQIASKTKSERENLNADDIVFRLMKNGTTDATVTPEATFQLLQGSLT